MGKLRIHGPKVAVEDVVHSLKGEEIVVPREVFIPEIQVQEVVVVQPYDDSELNSQIIMLQCGEKNHSQRLLDLDKKLSEMMNKPEVEPKVLEQIIVKENHTLETKVEYKLPVYVPVLLAVQAIAIIALIFIK